MSMNTTIYTGFWYNHSKGGVVGLTLTLSNLNAACLVAALAIFVQIIGDRLWAIICFVAHQVRTTKEPKNGFFHQQQAALRNNSSSAHSLWFFAQIGWSWRSNSVNSPRKTLPFVLIGIFHLLIFSAASIFSAYLTILDNEVIVRRSPYCGPLSSTPCIAGETPLPLLVYSGSYQTAILEKSGYRAQNCLAARGTLPECTAFKDLQLNWTSTKVACPFGDLCLGPENSSFYMDTGMINSRNDLGFNARDEDHVLWRRNATCSPITTQGYTRTGMSSINYTYSEGQIEYPNETSRSVPFHYTAMFYGPNPTRPTKITDTLLKNATYFYTNFREAAGDTFKITPTVYDLHVEATSPGFGFLPIEPLSIPDSAVTLIFASLPTSTLYMSPSDDLWLSAHRLMNATYIETDRNKTKVAQHTMYTTDTKISVLACVEQHQICNPLTSNCTPFLSYSQIQNYKFPDEQLLSTILLNPRQIATTRAILRAAYYSSIEVIVTGLNKPLLAQEIASDKGSIPLPSNQWILEASNLFTIGLASLQQILLDYITGPPPQYMSILPPNQTAITDNDPALKWLCEKQIVRRNDFTNFNTLALGIILGFGGLIVILSFSLKSIQRFVRAKAGWKQRSWWADGTIQLQRRAFEAMGIRGWAFGDWMDPNEIPVLDRNVRWSALENLEGLSDISYEARKVRKKRVSGTSLPLKAQIIKDTTIVGESPVNSPEKETAVEVIREVFVPRNIKTSAKKESVEDIYVISENGDDDGSSRSVSMRSGSGRDKEI